jgi:hypothetical protein
MLYNICYEKKREKIALILGITLIVILLINILPAPVDGKWETKAIACMCDSYKFLLFKDGEVINYTSNHTPYKSNFGNYKRISYNKYSISNNYGNVGIFKPGWIYGSIEMIISGSVP